MGSTEDWLASLRDKNAARVGAALSFDKRKPEDVAEADRIGRELGVPPIAVSSAPDVFRRQLEQRNTSALLKNAPKTAQWLSDARNGAIAKDDVENLTWFERNTFAIGRAAGRGVRRVPAIPEYMEAQASAKLYSDIGRPFEAIYAEELAKFPGSSENPVIQADARRAAQTRFDSAAGLGPDERAKILTAGAESLANARRILDDAANVPMSEGATAFRDGDLAGADNSIMGVLSAFAANPLGGAAFVAETAAEFLPALVISSGVTIATRNPAMGAVTMGAASGLTENTNSAMEFLAEKGVSLATPDEAMAALSNAELMQEASDRGVTRGVVIGAMDALSGGIAGKTLMKSPVGDMVAQGFAQVMFGAGGEALGQLASGQEIDWREIVIEGLAELATAPVEVVGVGGRGIVRRLFSAAKAGAAAEHLQAVGDTADQSKLKARDDGAFKSALDAQGHGDVYLQADELRELFQSRHIDPADWGLDADALDEAAMSGQMVPLSISTYAAKVHQTPEGEWVRTHAVMNPDGEISLADADRGNAEIQDVLRQAREEVADAIENERELRAADVQIYDAVFSQLRAAGWSPDVAQNEARAVAAFWRTMGERYGDDALELFRQAVLRVQGPQTDDGARRRGALDIQLNTLRAKGEAALKPRGQGLLDFVRSEGGIRDTGGDVASLDAPKGVIAETAEQVKERQQQPSQAGPVEGKGLGLDEMGRRAIEAGYFPEYMGGANVNADGTVVDEAAIMLDALAEAVAGRDRYLQGEGADEALTALSEALSERGIDLALSNDEIAALLESTDGQTYNQDGKLNTDTEAFRKWFGDSKVVDAEGKPLVVYHGTGATIEDGFAFDQSLIGANFGFDGRGFFFTDSEKLAQQYVSLSGDEIAELKSKITDAQAGDIGRALRMTPAGKDIVSRHVFPSYLSIQNPLTKKEITSNPKFKAEATTTAVDFFDTHRTLINEIAAEQGRDGVIINDRGDSLYVAFRPEQIKSVNNRGTFSPDDPRILYQPAYHGSPHIFDRFSLDHIGTGEGAQAFGWGIYLAGQRGVAEYYRDNLSSSGRGKLSIGGVVPTAPNEGLSYGRWVALENLSKLLVTDAGLIKSVGDLNGEGRGDVLAVMRGLLKDRQVGDAVVRLVPVDVVNMLMGGQRPAKKPLHDPAVLIELLTVDADDLVPGYVSAVDILAPLVAVSAAKVHTGLGRFDVSARDLDAALSAIGQGISPSLAGKIPQPEDFRKGRVYKVDIPEDSDLLAWDVPLSEQSDKVKAAIRKVSLPKPGLLKALTGKAAKDKWRAADFADMDFDKTTGEQFYQRLSYLLGEMSGSGQRSDQMASVALREAGIPGHRFLDQGSRADGDGTYNYVIYDDSRVNVLEFEQNKRGKISFPSGGLKSGETVITLFETADLSTFLHEASHYFLESFTALADDPNAPQQMRDDMAAIREWLGNDGGPFTTEQHEKWARGGEAYFMEGKAPSLSLADSFARFKAWLTRIYRTALGLNVKITPEIREVMDRMLATDAEIEEARAEAGMRPLFKSAPAGMAQSDFAAYQRLASRATETAERTLLEKTMAKVRREKEAWYKAEKKAVWAEVEASYNKRREYRLIEMLANERWFGSDREIADMRMDRAALVDMFGDGVLKEIDRSKLGGKRAIYKDGGEAPQDVAAFFGFANAIEMIETLQNAGKRRQAIAAEVDRVMTERHGDPLNDGSIEEEALAAIHNDQQAQVVAAEARTLAGQIGRKTSGLNTRVFRQRAKSMLGRMSVAEASKPQNFLAAERRAARNAEKAFARIARGAGEGALAEAYQAKEQQLLNHMLYMESRDFEKTVQRGREKMRDYGKKSVRAKLEGGYIEQIDALLEQYDFRKRAPGQVARAESLAQYVDRMIEAGREAELAIDARLMDEARKVHYSRLTADELRGLFDTIANIDHMGRFKQKLIDAKRKRDLAESASRVEGAILASQKPSAKRDSSRVLQALNLIRRPDTILIGLDGGAEMGPVYDELKRGIDEGQAEEQKAQVAMAERFDELFGGHYSRNELRRMVEPKAVAGVKTREWSKAEILSLALNMGAEENHQRVMDNNVDPEMRMDPETAHKLLSTLTENDWRFVQGMWDMVNSYWPELAAVHKRRTGVEPAKVQAQLMYDGAPDFVRGGYYPIKYDATRGKNAAKDEASAWDKFLTAGHGATAAVKNGMTKQRQKSGGGRTIKYDLSVPFQHLRDTVRYIALSEAVDNAYRILNHETVVEALQNTGNADTLKTLNLWIKDTAQGPIFNTDLLNTTARMVKNNFTLSRLAFNMKTVILQATGLGQSAATIGKKNMVRGLIAYMKRPHQLIDDVMEKSPFMAERKTTFQKDIYDFANDVKIQSPLAGRWSRSKKNIAMAGFWPMIKMQFLVVDMPTWLGAYHAGLETYKGDDTKAVHYADRMVARSQDSGMFGDRAAVERGTVSENVRQADFIRLFTTLGGYMLTKLNRAQVTMMQARAGVKEADTATGKTAVAVSAATDIILLLTFEPILMAMLYAMFTDDDEPEDVRNFIAAEVGMAIVGGIPIVRDMAGAVRGYGGGGIYGSVLEMPYRLGVQIMQGENDKSLRRAIGDVIGTVTGLPSTATTRLYEGFLGDGDTSPAEALMGSNPLTR